jgi:dolichol-phosphate mannosyltransferase
MDVKAVVCLPTYNERENLERMLRALADKAVQVLVIDDNSPDGTGELADRLAAELDFVAVLHRERKEGLGPAYLAGFGRALADGAELVLEMDADFSHDPADVPRLIEAARDAHVVLGSRYVGGGAIANWGPVRRFVSAGGSLYARILLGVPVHDLTGGFKCFRREVLEALDLDAVRSEGYLFQIELTYRAIQLGFRVTEIPFVFMDRRVGKSKMSGRIVREAALGVWRLRFSPRAARQIAPLRAERVEG